MNATHLHLMLNHIPVLGTAVGLGLLVFGLWRKNQELKKTALGVFVIVALLTVPVYLSGERAEDTAEALAGVSKASIEKHEEAASIAFTGVLLLGGAGLSGLLLFRRDKTVPLWFCSATLVGSLVVASLVAWTANLGGLVRHTELGQTAKASMT